MAMAPIARTRRPSSQRCQPEAHRASWTSNQWRLILIYYIVLDLLTTADSFNK
jgi:hypothetical protein